MRTDRTVGREPGVAERAVESDFHCFFGNLKRAGGFGCRHLFYVAQHDNRPVLRGKGRDTGLESGMRFAVRDVPFRAVGRRLKDLVAIKACVSLEPSSSKADRRSLPGSPASPCREAFAHILHHIFGLAVIVQNAAHDSVDALVVPPHQYLEQCRFTLS